MLGFTGCFHINRHLLPPPVLCWNSNFCNYVMSQTGRGSSWKEPLRTLWMKEHLCSTSLKVTQGWICWNAHGTAVAEAGFSYDFLQDEFLPPQKVNRHGLWVVEVHVFFIKLVSIPRSRTSSLDFPRICNVQGYTGANKWLSCLCNPQNDFSNCTMLLL